MGEKIAIIGGGIAGLSVGYYLSRLGTFELELFESAPVLGGHAHTVDYQGIPLDTSVVTFHKDAYPRFSALVAELGLKSETRVFRQDLCFHSDTGIDYLVSFDPKVWATSPLLLARTARAFQRLSRAIVRNRNLTDPITIRGFLEKHGFSKKEIEQLILPMMHMFLVVDLEAIAAMPAQFMIGLLYEHKVLHHSSHNSWLAWKQGTKTYVEALAAAIKGLVHVNARVSSVERLEHGIAVTIGGELKTFDRVIFASPPKRALALLRNPTGLESQLLSPWLEKTLQMKLHTDTSVLPKRPLSRGFWNPYLDKTSGRCSASYLMRKLQPRVAPDVVVSWDPIQPIAEDKVHYEKSFVISELSLEALRRQEDLRLLNTQGNRTYFCGSYFAFGWHESAVVSAHDVFELLRNGS